MTDPVIIIGIAGFGRETADVLDAMNVPIAGFLDDQPSRDNLAILDERSEPYLGTVTDWLEGTHAPRNYVVGIGAGTIRETLVTKMDAAGHRPFTAIHPTATFGRAVVPGVGTVICAGAHLSNTITLGKHVHINPNVTIGHDVELHDFVSINPSATVSGAVMIGRRTLIGAGATVLQNLTLGADIVVGAAALVTKDVPSGVTVTGLPGRW